MPGSTVGLVGRNGAGKTTTLRTIMGLVPAAAGQILLDGEDLVPLSPHRRCALGIGYMPEDRRLIGVLTVNDNLLVPAWAQGGRDVADRLDLVSTLLPEVAALLGRRASGLSGGQQKLVALARALLAHTASCSWTNRWKACLRRSRRGWPRSSAPFRCASPASRSWSQSRTSTACAS